MNYKEKYCKKGYSHYESSNIFSKFLWWWINPIFKITKKNAFEQDMHFNLPRKYRIETTNKQFYKSVKSNKNNILKGILNFIKNKTVIILGIIILAFINFFYTYFFIQINNLNIDYKDKIIDIKTALQKLLIYCIYLIAIEFLVSVVFIHLEYYLIKMTLIIKNNIIYLIIKKTLKLSQKGLNQTNEGNIINLIQVDSQKIEDNLNFLFYGIFIIFNSLFSWIYAFFYIGWVILVYIVIFSVILVLMKKIITINYKLEKELRTIKDNTSSLLKNIFYNIKYIKFNVFENFITKKIYNQKLKEIKIIKKMAVVVGFIIFFNWFNPKFSFLMLIFCFRFFSLSLNKLFPLLRIISAIENMFIYAPYLLQFYFEMKVTFERIQKFLDIEEENLNYIENINVKRDSTVSLSIRGSFIWNEKTEEKEIEEDKKKSKNIVIEEKKVKNIDFKLKDLNLEFQKNSLTFIVGKIGSGKTSLFYSILGELEKDNNNDSKIFVEGKISCSPQNYFLQSRSIKNNILFYDSLDEERLKNIIDICYLKEDFKLLEKGVDTEIGDEGINISGGQKARISLARSLYKNRNILILDDPIGALDTDVANHIMKDTIIEKLKDKTRIVITHSVQFLKHADFIIFMDNGSVKFNGEKEDFFKTDYYKVITEDLKKKEESDLDNIERKKSKKMSINEEEIKFDKNDIANKFILDEDKVSSRNLKNVLVIFFKKIGGIFPFLFIFILTISFTFSIYISTKYISDYTQKEKIISNRFLIIISLITIVPTIVCGFRGFYVIYLTANMSKKLHNEMIFRVLHAKIGEFLDRVPIGRLLNRFTKDIYNIEKTLSSYFSYILIKLCYTAVCYYAIINTTNKLTIIFVILFIIYAFYAQSSYIRISKDATRLEAITKTPILNITNEIVKGTFLFKSFNKKKEVKKELKNFINENTKNGILIGGITAWFQMRVSLSNIFIVQIFTYVIIIFIQKNEDFSQIPITIFFVIQLIESTIDFLNAFSNLENNLVSVERCNSFNEIPIEDHYYNYNKEHTIFLDKIENIMLKKLVIKKINNSQDINLSNEEINYKIANNLSNNKRLFKNGNIIFQNISARYPTKSINVLNNISFEIKSNEKIGIIGRTGAGKSSIIKLLTRYLLNNNGKILIDGYDISKLDLKKLRSEFFVLNQNISIFEGTLSENIDIQLLNSDKNLKSKRNSKKKINDLSENLIKNENMEVINKKKQILEILEKMGFNKDKLKEGLEFKIESEGKNLSQGEKQLICFVRGIFSESKILIFDEATANVDVETEKLMFKIMAPFIQNKTVLMIAHRLTTLLDCDKILTLSKGSIEDFRTIKELLNDESCYFKQMLNKYNKI